MKTFRTGFLSLLLISATVNAQPQVSPQADAAVVQTKEAALKTALFQMRDAIDGTTLTRSDTREDSMR